MKSIPTYTATIHCGLREEYGPMVHSIETARGICQEYVNKVGLCVTVTPTHYVYTDGNEPGVIVGLINYPRFPSTPAIIRERSLELAERLLRAFKQLKVSVVFSDETVMLEQTDEARRAA